MGILVHDDWSLDRRGQRAQTRHREKIKEAIRGNLADIVSHHDIILSDGKRTVRIPVKQLDEPHFRYDYGKQKHVGQGPGQKGQSIGKAVPEPSAPGSGAGDQPGEHSLEADVTLEEIEDAVFSDLCLPNLKDKPQTKDIMTDGFDFTDIRNKGIRSNIDRKRTLIEALRRSKHKGDRLTVTEDDLRFKTWEDTLRPETGAVVIAMMDVSGSMGTSEKYVARTFFFWMEKFLKKQYSHVDMRYLVHHTEAYETNKETFYSVRESGGTLCSSVFQAAKDLIQSDYPPELWNIYLMYISDGDNLFSDNEPTVTLIDELCNVASMIGYLEVNSYSRTTVLSKAVENLHQPEFRWTTIQDHKQILNALRLFFQRKEVTSA